MRFTLISASRLIALSSIAILSYGCASVSSSLGLSSLSDHIPGMDGITELTGMPGLADMPELEGMTTIPGMEGYPGMPQKVEPPPPLFETAEARTQRLEQRIEEMQEEVELSKDVCTMAKAELAVLDQLLGEPIAEKQLTLEPPTLSGRMTDYAHDMVVETATGFLGIIQPFIQTKRMLMNESREEQEAIMAEERNELRRAFVIGQASNYGCQDIQESVSEL